jgi:hypothetical protein
MAFEEIQLEFKTAKPLVLLKNAPFIISFFKKHLLGLM